MKRLLCFTAVFTMAATSALGQFTPPPRGVPKAVTYRNSGDAGAQSMALAEMVTRALDRSQHLRFVPVGEDGGMEIESHALVKEEGGARLTVRYRVNTQEYTATCTTSQLQQCAAMIVQRAERLARNPQFPGR